MRVWSCRRMVGHYHADAHEPVSRIAATSASHRSAHAADRGALGARDWRGFRPPPRVDPGEEIPPHVAEGGPACRTAPASPPPSVGAGLLTIGACGRAVDCDRLAAE